MGLQHYRRNAWRILRVLVDDFFSHSVMQLSAALTYYAVLSLFPALFIVVALLGVVGVSPDTLDQLLNGVAARTDSAWAAEVVSDTLSSILDSRATGIFLGAGTLASLYVSSGYVRAFMWASDRIYDPPARRSYWRGLPIRLGLAVLLILLFTTAAAMVTLLGPLGRAVATALGLPDSSLNDWLESASPLLVLAALLMLTLLYKYTPSRRQPRFWRLMIGALLAMVLSAFASLAFGFYLANYASYNRVYGTLGAVIAFLVWLWILNVAALIGVEINRAVEIQSARKAAAVADGGGTTPADHRAAETTDEAQADRQQERPNG